jgi:hypothetical protein
MTSPTALKVLTPFSVWTVNLNTGVSPVREVVDGANRLQAERTSKINNDKEVRMIFFIHVSFF